jgi:hypothetical protein
MSQQQQKNVKVKNFRAGKPNMDFPRSATRDPNVVRKQVLGVLVLPHYHGIASSAYGWRLNQSTGMLVVDN